MKTILAAALVLMLPVRWANAEVADSSANGFTVKITLAIHAAPDEVYRKLIRNVGDWWNPEHTFSRDSHNLTIEAKPMGCFFRSSRMVAVCRWIPLSPSCLRD